MGSQSEDHVTKMLQAQTKVFNHIFSFINSMSLKCAIELSIPDVIQNYGQPIPLSQLIAKLPIHPSKTSDIYRLMRVLTHCGFFNVIENNNDVEEVMYELNDASRLLLKDHPYSMTSLLHVILGPIMSKPWYQLSSWYKNEDLSPFHTENNGVAFWDYAGHDPKLNELFNEAMACETRMASSVVMGKFREVFEEMESLVDVGGGLGTMSMAIAKSFPKIDCVVFDLPHVVDGLQESENLKYVGGDMFEAIPPTHSILLKGVLHDWNDEECLKILKKCKEAIMSKGKVVIIDAVMGNEKEENETIEAQLFYDLEMMVLVNGKERNEKEWSKLFFSAGFREYKITHGLGFKSLIEVFP
ncbi:probable O-methyltransferase 3 [Lathyrus oleraceus]|uniref:isoflavone 7-O-methyltransferase n=1 Tax=Pisum sativum TaxID=3888 RepID=A0A9D4VQU1_PEA|nr:probable O-methyltransferase 3 [Pisum sativum]KAI5387738.1 putative O-methyltransferase 3 [Pisum sativum]